MRIFVSSSSVIREEKCRNFGGDIVSKLLNQMPWTLLMCFSVALQFCQPSSSWLCLWTALEASAWPSPPSRWDTSLTHHPYQWTLWRVDTQTSVDKYVLLFLFDNDSGWLCLLTVQFSWFSWFPRSGKSSCWFLLVLGWLGGPFLSNICISRLKTSKTKLLSGEIGVGPEKQTEQ